MTLREQYANQLDWFNQLQIDLDKMESLHELVEQGKCKITKTINTYELLSNGNFSPIPQEITTHDVYVCDYLNEISKASILDSTIRYTETEFGDLPYIFTCILCDGETKLERIFEIKVHREL